MRRIALAVSGVCGDAALDAFEDCDDGGNLPCDGCSPDCGVESGLVCGDGVLNASCEDCDDGNTLGGDGCPGDCTYLAFYDQTDGATGTGAIDQETESAYHAHTSEAADDFVVTAARGWDVRRVVTPGITTNGGQPIHVNLAFYPDLGGVPGSGAQCEFLGIRTFSHDFGDLRTTLPADCSLPPGHWWIAQRVRMDLYPPASVHRWGDRATQADAQAVWRNPEDVLGTGCGDWTPKTQCGSPAGDGPDLRFRLEGDDTDSPEPVPGPGPVGLLVTALVLGSCARFILRRPADAG